MLRVDKENVKMKYASEKRKMKAIRCILKVFCTELKKKFKFSVE